jgi:hypothetical protein
MLIIPIDPDDAARIDGYSGLQILTKNYSAALQACIDSSNSNDILDKVE